MLLGNPRRNIETRAREYLYRQLRRPYHHLKSAFQSKFLRGLPRFH